MKPEQFATLVDSRTKSVVTALELFLTIDEAREALTLDYFGSPLHMCLEGHMGAMNLVPGAIYTAGHVWVVATMHKLLPMEQIDLFYQQIIVPHTAQVLIAKAAEYSRNDERLHNFYRASRIMGVSPVEACIGMLAKHLVSLLDMIDDFKKGSFPTKDAVMEKGGDLINYLYLLEGLTRDK